MPGDSSDPIQTRELSAGKLKVGTGQTPIATQGAYTQTYSTADKTISNPTATSMGDLVAVQNTGWGATNEADFDKITTQIDNLIADNLDLRKAITALIDDLQAFGLVG